MKNKKNNLKGLLGRLVVGSAFASGIVGLSGCNANWYKHDDTTYINREEGKFTIVGKWQRDGSIVYDYPRDPMIQNKIKDSLRRVMPDNITYNSDGTISDIKCMIKFQDGSAVIKYYDK